MDKACVRFSNSKYLDLELDPKTNKVTINAVLNNTKVTGAVTLKAAKATKAAKMEVK